MKRLLLLLACLCLFLLLLFKGCERQPPAPDAQLIETFNENRELFEEITGNVRKYRIQRLEIDSDGDIISLRALAPVPDDIASQISTIMHDKLSVEIVDASQLYLFGEGDFNVGFSMSRSGFVFGGEAKSIDYFSGKPPSPLVPDTDRYIQGILAEKRATGWVTAYREIADHWYITYSFDD